MMQFIIPYQKENPFIIITIVSIMYLIYLFISGIKTTKENDTDTVIVT